MNVKSDKSIQVSDLTISADTTIYDSLNILEKAGIGILLICDPARRLVGLLTDGDVRRYLLRKGSLDAPVSNLMNRDFIALKEAEKPQANDVLKKNRISHVPILDTQGRVVDLVTTFDFLGKEDKKYCNPVVIMAGGKGSRLSPLTKIIPKPLVPIGDQTMIEMIMENFKARGFYDFRIIINYKKELIKSYFNENNISDKVTLIEENEYLGTAGGLNLLKNSIDKTFLLSNCDIIARLDYALMLEWHKEHDAELTILGVQKKIDVPYGVINVNRENYVTGIDEKPFYKIMIISGIYIIEPSIFDIIPESSFLGMDKLIEKAIKSGKKVTCYPIENGWFDIGQFDEYKSLLKRFGVLSA